MISPLGLVWLGVFTMSSLGLHKIGAQATLAGPVVTFLIAGLVLRRVPRWRRFGTWMLAGSPFTLALLLGFLGECLSVRIGHGRL